MELVSDRVSEAEHTCDFGTSEPCPGCDRQALIDEPQWSVPAPKVRRARLRAGLGSEGLVTHCWIAEPRPNRWDEDAWIEVTW
jgi:hypothetical protein